jgi:U4/U6 small nuclear ribonucleoprotein PRP3
LQGNKYFGPKPSNPENKEDMALLNIPLNYEDFSVSEEAFNVKKVTHYVQHPVPVKNPNVEAIKGKTKILMTEKQIKRIKKLKKAEKVKERHERVHLGLDPPPEPRLKMSSFMRAVTAQAVADPSKVEKEVRRQEIERQKKHIEHNEKRRLTKAQRKEKVKSKFERDTKKETWSALFKIKSLKDPKVYFKIDKNAQQLYLSGVCLYTEKLKEEGVHYPNLIVVEGGKVAVRKYKRLLLRRIQWPSKKPKSDSESDSDEEMQENKAKELKSTED